MLQARPSWSFPGNLGVGVSTKAAGFLDALHLGEVDGQEAWALLRLVPFACSVYLFC